MYWIWTELRWNCSTALIISLHIYLCCFLCRWWITYLDLELSQRVDIDPYPGVCSCLSVWIFVFMALMVHKGCTCIHVAACKCACVFTWQSTCEAPVSIPLVMSTHSLHHSWPKVCQTPPHIYPTITSPLLLSYPSACTPSSTSPYIPAFHCHKQLLT